MARPVRPRRLASRVAVRRPSSGAWCFCCDQRSKPGKGRCLGRLEWFDNGAIRAQCSFSQPETASSHVRHV
eukprot:4405847-Alexandrium_andersonii.AAC.1